MAQRRHIRFGTYALITMLALAFGLAADGRSTEASPKKETYTGVAIFPGGIGAGGTTPFTIYIDQYSSDEQRATLSAALERDGQKGLLEALGKMECGRIAFGAGTGTTINAAVSSPKGDGRVIRLLTERPISAPEIRADTRSRDYPFGYIELELDDDGDGEGQMIVAAQVSVLGGGEIRVENYGARPIRLQGVTMR